MGIHYTTMERILFWIIFFFPVELFEILRKLDKNNAYVFISSKINCLIIFMIACNCLRMKTNCPLNFFPVFCKHRIISFLALWLQRNVCIGKSYIQDNITTTFYLLSELLFTQFHSQWTRLQKKYSVSFLTWSPFSWQWKNHFRYTDISW